jgi:hypothetical protein
MLTASYTSFILDRLVKKGYDVGQLSMHKHQLIMGNRGAPSQLLAIHLDTFESKSVEDVIKDVMEVLERVKVKHHGVIVVEAPPDARWTGSNISLEDIEKEKIKKRQHRPPYLTLVRPPKEEPLPEKRD